MVKMAGSLVKEAIVNTTLGMILGCDIVLHRIGVADTIIFGVGVRIACSDERGNARPGCGMSDVRGLHFSLYIDAPNMRPALFGLDMATNRTGH